jgi:hypothetical protein
MKYAPTAIQAVDLDSAEAPYLGGEFSVYLSRVPATLLCQVDMTASGSGVFSANNGASIDTGRSSSDLQCVAHTELRSDVECVVTFTVTGGGGTATATFAPAARSGNQTYSFQRGVAVDLVPASTSTPITAITGVQSIVGGSPNVSFQVYQLPEAADYTLVGCTTDKKFNMKGRMPIGIDCGMEADAFVKRGRTNKGELSLASKFAGMHEKLVRFSGAKTTAMLVGIKDGVVTTDRMVFTQYTPTVDVNLPDGDGEATEDAATGKFVEHLFFVAP